MGLYINVSLTENQKKELKPIMVKKNEACKKGRLGIVLGQFFERGEFFKVGFVEHEKALKIMEIIRS